MGCSPPGVYPSPPGSLGSTDIVTQHRAGIRVLPRWKILDLAGLVGSVWRMQGQQWVPIHLPGEEPINMTTADTGVLRRRTGTFFKTLFFCVEMQPLTVVLSQLK